MIEEIREFVSFFDLNRERAADLRQLAAILEKLGCVYHQIPSSVFQPDAKDPPDKDMSASASAIITRTFPDFGYYVWNDPCGKTSEPMMGDAIDDLVDIYAEMLEVIWRWENNGPVDAAWYYRLSYEGHWGRHLQNLRSYVHAKIFEA